MSKDFGNPDIDISVPQVSQTSSTPDIYKDSDSVLTFRSAIPRHQRSANQPYGSSKSPLSLQAATTVLFPNLFHDLAPSTTTTSAPTDDGSISKMSDTASRLSAFESRFDSIAQGFSSSLQLLRDQSETQAKAQEEQGEILQKLMLLLLPPPPPGGGWWVCLSSFGAHGGHSP